MMRGIRESLTGYLFVLPAVFVLLASIALPAVDAFVLSLQSWDGINPVQWVGLRNYHKLLRDPVFAIALRNTAYFVGATIVFHTTVPLLIALLLNSGVRGSRLFRTIYFMPNIISLTISGMLWMMIYEPNFGVLNEVLRAIGLGTLTQLWLASPKTVMTSVIITAIWQALGFYMVIFFASLQNLPQELYEAAAIDGANRLQRLFRITIPLLSPIFTVVVVLNIIFGVRTFDLMWVMTKGGPLHASETLATHLYIKAFGPLMEADTDLGYGSAIAMVILVISFVLSVMRIRLGRGREIEY